MVVLQVADQSRGEGLQGEFVEFAAQVEAVVREIPEEVAQHGVLPFEQLLDVGPVDEPQPAVVLCDDRYGVDVLRGEDEGRSHDVGSREGVEDELPPFMAGHPCIDAPFAQQHQRSAYIVLEGDRLALAVTSHPAV